MGCWSPARERSAAARPSASTGRSKFPLSRDGVRALLRRARAGIRKESLDRQPQRLGGRSHDPVRSGQHLQARGSDQSQMKSIQSTQAMPRQARHDLYGSVEVAVFEG